MQTPAESLLQNRFLAAGFRARISQCQHLPHRQNSASDVSWPSWSPSWRMCLRCQTWCLPALPHILRFEVQALLDELAPMMSNIWPRGENTRKQSTRRSVIVCARGEGRSGNQAPPAVPSGRSRGERLHAHSVRAATGGLS